MSELDPSGPGSDAGAPLVLVVEDDPNCALVVKRRLEMENLRVLEAGDGRQGLAMALEHEPDVIVSDWMMPHMDGPSLCEAIRAERSIASTYVIILSNRTERPAIRASIECDQQERDAGTISRKRATR